MRIKETSYKNLFNINKAEGDFLSVAISTANHCKKKKKKKKEKEEKKINHIL